MSESKKPKLGKIIEGAEQLSLGISIVVAILIGVGIGLFLKSFFNQNWLLWVGVFWGVSAAILNVYKAYKQQMKSLDELKDDVRYKKYQQNTKEEDDE
ncbi:MAG: AtpZ/AtpI family protein [Sulfurospirillaceae bacterium]|nr:AtpZ/AtpI family protein [Sulfurospirillaceae bacterium]MDD3462835.1 AtpZ/AtpI family protein [Sulfurospirillaceae bacterium]